MVKKRFLLCMKYMSESFVVVNYKLNLIVNYLTIDLSVWVIKKKCMKIIISH